MALLSVQIVYCLSLFLNKSNYICIEIHTEDLATCFHDITTSIEQEYITVGLYDRHNRYPYKRFIFIPKIYKLNFINNYYKFKALDNFCSLQGINN